MALAPAPASAPSAQRSPERLTAPYVASLLAVVVALLLAGPASAGLTWAIALGAHAVASVMLRPSRRAVSAGLFVVVTVALLHLDVPDLGSSGQLFGVLAVGACLAPFAIRPLTRTSGFPFLHVFCLLQGVYLYVGFLIGAQSGDYATLFYTPGRRISGLGYYALFMAVVSGTGLLLYRRRTSPGRRGRLGSGGFIALNHRAVFNRAAALFLAGFSVRLMLLSGQGVDGFGALPDFMSLVRVLGFAAMVWLWLHQALSPMQKFAVMTFGGFDIFLGLGTGAIYESAALVFATFIMILIRLRRIPWVLLVIGVSITLGLNAAKQDFREDVERRPGATSAIASEAVRFALTAAEIPSSIQVDEIEQAAFRFAVADVMGYTADVVPSRYGYWDKQNYVNLPYGFVPRVVAPWKPEYDNANEFGRRFGLLAKDDFITSANTPIPVEAWANFGLGGFLAVGALVGGALAWAGRRVHMDRPTHILVGAVLSIQLLGGIESGMTAWILVLPTAIAVFPLSRWMLHGRM